MNITIIEGIVYNDDAKIADYDASTNTVTTPKRIGPAYIRPIRAVAGEDVKFLVLGAEAEGGATEGPFEEGPGVPDEQIHVADDDEPARDPQSGDKDPAWVAWMLEHKPDVYRARYAHRIAKAG